MAIISTSKGLLTDSKAREAGLGGKLYVQYFNLLWLELYKTNTNT